MFEATLIVRNAGASYLEQPRIFPSNETAWQFRTVSETDLQTWINCEDPGRSKNLARLRSTGYRR